MELERTFSSTLVTFSPEPSCEHCSASPRATVLLPSVSNATVENPEVIKISEESAAPYYVYSEVLLGTALVLAQNCAGEFIQCRALLDSGSQLSLITRSCADRLRLMSREAHLHVSGVAGTNVKPIHHVSSVTLKSSLDSKFMCNLETYILPKVTGPLPTKSFLQCSWPHVTGLRMADPDYNMSREVDLLLGADCLPFLMRNDMKIGAVGQPLAQATAFGWVLLGPIALKLEPFHPKKSKGNETVRDEPKNSDQKKVQETQGPRSADSSEKVKNRQPETPGRKSFRGNSSSFSSWLCDSFQSFKRFL